MHYCSYLERPLSPDKKSCNGISINCKETKYVSSKFLMALWQTENQFSSKVCSRSCQNLHWQFDHQSWCQVLGLIGTSWDYLGLSRDYGLDLIFFRNIIFLFYKTECWNFQHQFEKEFCETSKNVKVFSWFRQFLFPFFYWLSDWDEILLAFTEFLFQTDAENFSFVSWKTKKVSSLKKIFFKPLSISKQKSFVYWPNFQWKFWLPWPYWKEIYDTHSLRIYGQTLGFWVHFLLVCRRICKDRIFVVPLCKS